MKLKTKEQLPFKYFAVKNDNSLDFKEYVTWLNRECNVNFYGTTILAYYGYDGNTSYWRGDGCYVSKDITTFKNNPKVFTAKEFMEMLKKDEILYLEPRLVAKFTKNSELKTYLEIARLNKLTAIHSFYDINDNYLSIDKNNLVVSLVCSPYKDEYKFISDTEFVLRLQNTIDKLNKEKMSNKKLIGYKAPMDLFDNEIKKGTIFTKQKARGKEVYEPAIAIDDGYHLPTEIVETWEPVYESQEVTVSMGAFKVKVTPEGIFHKREDITDFVRVLLDHFDKKPIKLAGYPVSYNNVTFSNTGCEHSETKLSQWTEVWNIYQKLKN